MVVVEADKLPEAAGRKPSDFLDSIARSDLKEVLTPQTPYVSVSLEVGADLMPFTGGLGILEGDKLLQAEASGIPYTALTLAYSQRWLQGLQDYWQTENFESVTPEDLGLSRIGKTKINIIGWNGEEIVKDVDICQKSFGSAQILALYMPDLREVYYGGNDSEHRFFQQVVLGFGGQAAMDQVGLSPSLLQVNESAPVFSAVANLDKLVESGLDFEQALAQVRAKTLFTNHTLVQAAVSSLSGEYFERLVIPNVKSEIVRDWLRGIIVQESGGLELSKLAFELSGVQNGVSQIHAEISSFNYRRLDGSSVHFEANTNGIFIGRWTHPRFLASYLQSVVVDKNYLMADSAQEMIDNLDYKERLSIKNQAKHELVSYLRGRIDQDGNPIELPQESKIAVWSRRLAGYKQPFMFLKDPEELARVLEQEDMHLIMAGKAHPTDELMKEHLRDNLNMIKRHPVLSARVHFVQDYDAELAQHLVAGADIWLNTPRPGEEACGTSPFKAIVNDTIVVSTEDGGLADKRPASYIVIEGDEIYDRLRQASQEASNPFLRVKRVKAQLKDYIDTIPSGQMQEKYINLGYPQQDLPQAA